MLRILNDLYIIVSVNSVVLAEVNKCQMLLHPERNMFGLLFSLCIHLMKYLLTSS